MDSKEVLTLIQLALGKASVAFMSQPDGGKIVMPTEELLETANELCEAIMAMARKDYARIAELEAKVSEIERDSPNFVERCLDRAFQEAHDRKILDREFEARRVWKHIRAFAIEAAKHR